MEVQQFVSQVVFLTRSSGVAPCGISMNRRMTGRRGSPIAVVYPSSGNCSDANSPFGVLVVPY